MGAPGTDSDRLVLRRLLQRIAVTSADLDALCLDWFPSVHRQFTPGMNRKERETLLLSSVDPAVLLSALQYLAPEVVFQEAAALIVRRPEQEDYRQVANPYRGLAPFGTEDAHLFFGREQLTRALLQRLRRLMVTPGEPRMLTLLGPSGSGKSSLARCGIVHGLSQDITGQESVLPVVVRPGRRPFLALARALSSLVHDAAMSPPDGIEQLADELRRRSPGAACDGLSRLMERIPEAQRPHLVLVLDQFEELYNEYTDEAVRTDLADALLYASTDPQVLVSCVLVLRSDHLPDVRRHNPSLSHVIAAANVVIPPLSEDELRSAIAEPARRVGVSLNAAFVDLLVEQTRQSANHLPLLQFALTQIWNGIVAGQMPEETLRAMGGVGGALARQAQGLYNDLTSEKQAHLRRILLRLIQVGSGARDTCRRMPVSQLVGHSVQEAAVLQLLRPFTDEGRRLLTLSSSDLGSQSERLVEITHEALLEQWKELRAWLDSGRHDCYLHDRISEAARLWHEQGRHDGRLWRSPDLELLRDYHTRCGDGLTRQELQFYLAAERRSRRARWFRRMRALLIFGLLFALGIGYVWQEREHQRQRESDLYVGRARSELLAGRASDALPPLLRALALHSPDPSLPFLVADAIRPVSALEMVITGRAPQMASANFSPDGMRIVVGSGDGALRVLDANTGAIRLSLTGHAGSINKAAYSPDGKRILSASADGTACIWDAETGSKLLTFAEHTAALNGASWSHNSELVATASADKTVRIWHSGTGKQLGSPILHPSFVNAVTFSPDGKRVATACADWKAYIWDLLNDRQIRVLDAHQGPVNSVAFDPTGQKIATAGADRQVFVWGVENPRFPRALIGHDSYVNSVDWSRDGEAILTSSADGTICEWEARSAQRVQRLEGHRAGVREAVFDSSGSRVISVGGDRTARIWSLAHSKLQRTLYNASQVIHGGSLGHQEKLMAIARADHSIVIVDTATRRPLMELKGHRAPVHSLVWTEQDKLLATAAEDGVVLVWDIAAGRLRRQLSQDRGVTSSIAFCRDGTQLLAGYKDGQTVLWDIQTGTEQRALQRHSDWVNSVGFSPNGGLAFTASGDRQVRIYRTDTWVHVTTLSGHQDRVRSAAFSPSGRLLVTGSEDLSTQVWQVGSWKRLQILRDHHAVAHWVGVSQDDGRILTTSRDLRTCVWDLVTGQPLNCLRDHVVPIKSAQFAAGGRQAITFGEDGIVRQWDVAPEERPLDQLTALLRCVEPGQQPSPEDPWNICVASSRPRDSVPSASWRVGVHGEAIHDPAR